MADYSGCWFSATRVCAVRTAASKLGASMVKKPSTGPVPVRQMRNSGTFHTSYCDAYSPRRLRREATHLAAAWNGLRAVAQHWTTATEADWHAWIATMTRVDRTPRQLARQVETLYRFYAFWHWYDPRRVPRLFWPSEPPARQRWLQQFWDAEYSREHQPLR